MQQHREGMIAHRGFLNRSQSTAYLLLCRCTVDFEPPAMLSFQESTPSFVDYVDNGLTDPVLFLDWCALVTRHSRYNKASKANVPNVRIVRLTTTE